MQSLRSCRGYNYYTVNYRLTNDYYGTGFTRKWECIWTIFERKKMKCNVHHVIKMAQSLCVNRRCRMKEKDFILHIYDHSRHHCCMWLLWNVWNWTRSKRPYEKPRGCSWYCCVYLYPIATMADEMRMQLLEQIKEQGDVVRKLKATKADSTQVSFSLYNIK